MRKIKLQNLVSLAQQDIAPCVDVADGVIAALAGMTQRNSDLYRPYLWMGVASAAVAACILIAATLSWQGGQDSVNEVMTYVSWVTK